jgi:hypothetical protein
MGLLDELRQEAASAKSREQEQRERMQRLREIYATEVNPRIEELYRYLKELEEHLNYLKPDVWVDYELPGFGVVSDLRQGNYSMEKGRKEQVHRVPFSFSCSSEGELKYKVEGEKRVRTVMEELTAAGMRYTTKKIRGDNNDVIGADFIVECSVPVKIMFEGVLETSGITMTIKNYDDLYTHTSYLKPFQVNEEFLDELGKFILRKPNRFLKLDLDEDNLDQIRGMVRTAEQQRQHELELAEMRERQELEEQRKHSLLGRLKTVTEKIKK